MKRKEVIKHSAAIQVSNSMTLTQRRAWNVLLANAYNSLEKEDKFSLSLRELSSVLEYNSKNDKYLKQLLRDLIDIKVEWNILRKDNSHDWGVMALLAQVRIINGVLIYGYAPDLREMLNNPVMYARISLSLQNKFNSKHSLALYELFIDYFHIKLHYGETPWISVEKFRNLIGLRDNEYKEFKTLNLHIIKKSIKEINEKANIQVRIDYQRNGRKVTAVKFFIKENPKNPIELNTTTESSSQSDQHKLPLAEFEIENQKLFNTLISEFGMSNNKAVEILKTKDEFDIEEVLKSVRALIETSKIKDIPTLTTIAIEYEIKNEQLLQLLETLLTEFGLPNNKALEFIRNKEKGYLEQILNVVRQDVDSGIVKKTVTGYTIRAIEQDYRRKKPKTELKEEQQKRREEQAQKEKAIINALRAEFDQQYKSQIDKYLGDLSDSQKNDLIKEFENDEIATTNSFLRKSYRTKGLKSFGNQIMFRAYVAKRFLPEEDAIFEMFAKKQGYSVIKLENNEYKLDAKKD